MNTDLSGVKVGDYVAEKSRWDGVLVHQVDRVTATQIVTGNEKWSKERGALVGDKSVYHRRYIYVARPEDFIAARVRRAQNKVSRLVVTADCLDAAEALIAAAESGKAMP